MAKTWRRESDNLPAPSLRPTIEEDEDINDVDPRTYNVIQRIGQERDTRRLAERDSTPGWVDLPLRDTQ